MMGDARPDPTAFLQALGHCLVNGGPGSGKTTLALDKAVARIKTGLDPGQSVLFLSFSRAAVGRLMQAQAQLVPHQLRVHLSIQTFHGFFWNILACHAYLLGAPHNIQILMPHDERALSGGIKPANPAWPAWEVEREALFLQEGRLAFDLFAPMTLRLLRRSASINEMIGQRYPTIIVDEAQDTGTDAWEIIKSLKYHTQIICLADLDQQIFDHLPGVGPERVEAIRSELQPLELDLGQQNNRSPGTEIAAFGNDVINSTPRGRRYIGVSALRYNPQTVDWNMQLRRAIAIVYHQARAAGMRPESCAIIASNGREVAEITAALSKGTKPVAHKVVFDEAQSLLASRFAAFMLEPKDPSRATQHVIDGLEFVATVESAAGTAGGGKVAADCRRWASDYATGKIIPTRSLGAALRTMMLALHAQGFTGDPRVDWLRVKHAFRSCPNSRIAALAGHLDYLVAFGRGQFLAAALLECWSRAGTYLGARAAFDTALAQDSILEASQDLRGIHVMNVHRSKGKQFDTVIVVRKGVPGRNGQWRSSFVWRDDAPPYQRSRKILRVAVTRARKHVLFLTPAYPSCPLLSGHVL